jgi:hypothetical protein
MTDDKIEFTIIPTAQVATVDDSGIIMLGGEAPTV